MPPPRRLAVIDIARSCAILAMALFHFTYDLELFGFVPAGTMASQAGVWSARVIAGSFLFLSGVSLVLASLQGPLQPRKYLRRLAMIGFGALAVTAGTYFAMGSVFVRFGILHLMFVASLLGLIPLRLPVWVSGALGVLVLSLPHLLTWPALGSVHWLWLGTTQEPVPAMVDYAPVIPWFGLFLLGMSAAQLANRRGWLPALASLIQADRRSVRVLSWPGQHALAIYLLHQPVLFGAVMLARMASGG